MPKKATDLPAYFEQVEGTFQRLKIAEDLQLLILQKYFSDESKKLIAEHVQSTDYNEVKAIILRANKLSPAVYRNMFTGAQKLTSETFIQFLNRLKINLGYYIKIRKVGTNFEKLINLLVVDKLKDNFWTTMSVRHKI